MYRLYSSLNPDSSAFNLCVNLNSLVFKVFLKSQSLKIYVFFNSSRILLSLYINLTFPSFILPVPSSILVACVSFEGICLIPSSLNLFVNSITFSELLLFCILLIRFRLSSFIFPIPESYIDCIESPKKPIIFSFLLLFI